MNERIRQLADHAKAYANQCTKDIDGDVSWHWMDYYTEKFAELIVRDCMLMCDCAEASLLEHSYPRESDGAASVKIFIKEHFGVEE